MGSYYYHTNSKNAVLAYSHYSDEAFDGAGAVIFGSKEVDLQWEYDDRLRQFDSKKHKEAWDSAVAKCGKKRTAKRIEVYLRHYFSDDNLELVCIVSGTRPFDGYPWYAYGFSRGNTDE